jgi:hypothetical protein
MTTLDEGRIKTCLLPLFSALERVFRQSASTDILVIFVSGRAELIARLKYSTVSESARQSDNYEWLGMRGYL